MQYCGTGHKWNFGNAEQQTALKTILQIGNGGPLPEPQVKRLFNKNFLNRTATEIWDLQTCAESSKILKKTHT